MLVEEEWKKRQDPEKEEKTGASKKKKRQEPAKTEASCKATFPFTNQNLQTFPFTGNMDKRGFGYDGISDKITTHGRSHLALLRESYQKSGLKREKYSY